MKKLLLLAALVLAGCQDVDHYTDEITCYQDGKIFFSGSKVYVVHYGSGLFRVQERSGAETFVTGNCVYIDNPGGLVTPPAEKEPRQ